MPGEIETLSLSCRIACVALAIGFFEQASVFQRAFGPQGPFSTTVISVFSPGIQRWPFLGGGVWPATLFGGITSSMVTLLGIENLVGRWALLATLIAMLVVKTRRVLGSDGAEQIAVLTVFAGCLACFPTVTDDSARIAIWFIAAQGVLSYLTAGVAKARSTVWRSGEALTLILGSEAYGRAWTGLLVSRFTRPLTFLARVTIAFECLFPLVLVLPAPLAAGLLGCGLLFHLGCAFAMGLNAFLFAFPATYPCIFFVTLSLASHS